MKYLLVAIVVGIIGALGLNYCFPLPLDKYHDLALVFLDREAKLLSVQLSRDQKWRLPLDIRTVNPFFKDCLLTIEDKRFYYHPGVDPLALGRAVWQMIRSRQIVSGGSTITMQTAKLLSPGPRTLGQKCKEILRALQLEWYFSKNEILQIYLTLAPYGRNLEGLRAASLAYFGREPNHLSLAQAAFLVALPQNPNRFRPDKNLSRALQQRNKVLQLYQRHRPTLTPSDLACAMQEELPVEQFPFPHLAYHLTHYLKSHNSLKRNPYPTSLQSSLQEGVEQVLQQTHFPQAQTAAAIVIDNQNCEVIAYVGSAMPYARAKNGYVDMIRAVRSPGSTLKPFVYGLAFHEGWLNPNSIIADRPHQFGYYSPSNFLDHFHGKVTVAEALQRSLNIPVVKVLERLGPVNFMHFFKDFEIELSLNAASQAPPSLAIGLGGVGTRLLDLVALYGALANQGMFKPLSFDSPSKSGARRMFNASAANLISTILRAAALPPGYAPKGIETMSPIAFKTGTSYGHRDAWCVGYTHKYTVGVWTGRADGTPVPEQLGRLTAAPLLFKIFTLVDKEALATYPTSDHSLIPNHSLYQDQEEEALTITFPLPESNLLIVGKAPISLSVQGGVSPYTWLIDNQPLIIQTNHQQVFWHDPTAGFHEITVLDNEGHAARVRVRNKTISQ